MIGRGSRGYVALYRYVPELDTAFVLAIRSSARLAIEGTEGLVRPCADVRDCWVNGWSGLGAALRFALPKVTCCRKLTFVSLVASDRFTSELDVRGLRPFEGQLQRRRTHGLTRC